MCRARRRDSGTSRACSQEQRLSAAETRQYIIDPLVRRADKGGGSTQHAPEEVDVRRLVGAPSVFLILISAVLGAAIITFLDPTLVPNSLLGCLTCYI